MKYYIRVSAAGLFPAAVIIAAVTPLRIMTIGMKTVIEFHGAKAILPPPYGKSDAEPEAIGECFDLSNGAHFVYC